MVENSDLVLGQEVVFTHDFDCFPHAFVKCGEKGIIVGLDSETVKVQLEKYHEGLDCWKNQAYLNLYDVSRGAYIKGVSSGVGA